MNALWLETRWAPGVVFSELDSRPEYEIEADVRLALDTYWGEAFGRSFVAGPELGLRLHTRAENQPSASALFRLQLL